VDGRDGVAILAERRRDRIDPHRTARDEEAHDLAVLIAKAPAVDAERVPRPLDLMDVDRGLRVIARPLEEPPRLARHAARAIASAAGRVSLTPIRAAACDDGRTEDRSR